MIKTVLANILDVSKDMQIPPTYIGNFFGYEIGAKAAFDEKKAERQQAYVTGEQDVKDLSRLVEQFINQVLLCPNCGLPETRLVPKDNEIYGQCRACGANSKLPITNDKFKRYVINHPPSYDKNKAFQGSQAKKSDNKKGKKEDGAEEGEVDETPADSIPVPEDGEKKEKKEKKSKKEKKDKDEADDEDDVVWYTDTSEEAAKKRREALLPPAVVQKFEGTATSAANQQEAQISEMITNFDKLKLYKADNNLADDAWVKLLWNVMFNGKDVKIELSKHRPILTKFTRSKLGQLNLLKCIEGYAPSMGDQLKKQLPGLLKEFYDADVLVEEFIIQWSDKECVDASVKAAATPFVTWLKEAEEDEGDDE